MPIDLSSISRIRRSSGGGCPGISRPPSPNTSGLNGRIALALTAAVGTDCGAPRVRDPHPGRVLAAGAITGGILLFVQWVSQTFIQLVMLSVIMVGQNVLSRASDKRAVMTYNDADATFHEAGQIQAHLAAQDAAMNTLLDKVPKLEATVSRP